MAVTLAGLLSGCARSGAGPPAETADRYRGTFETICSPIDAHGVGFELWPADGAELPRLSVALWPAGGLAAGQRLQLGFEGDGHAAAHLSGTEWTQASGGVLQLETFADGRSAAGWLRVEFGDGSRLDGWFEADWLDRGPVYCG